MDINEFYGFLDQKIGTHMPQVSYQSRAISSESYTRLSVWPEGCRSYRVMYQLNFSHSSLSCMSITYDLPSFHLISFTSSLSFPWKRFRNKAWKLSEKNMVCVLFWHSFYYCWLNDFNPIKLFKIHLNSVLGWILILNLPSLCWATCCMRFRVWRHLLKVYCSLIGYIAYVFDCNDSFHFLNHPVKLFLYLALERMAVCVTCIWLLLIWLSLCEMRKSSATRTKKE